MRGKYLRILAAAFALLPVLSGCGEKSAEKQGDATVNQENSVNVETPAGDMETIYLRTEARSYDDNGEVDHLETWEYDDRGMLLRYEEDEDWEESFNEELYVYERVRLPIDGEVDEVIALGYDDRGGLISCNLIQGTNTIQEDYFEWRYDGEQTLGFTICAQELAPGMVTAEVKCDFEYDENGNLTQIYSYNTEGEKNYLYTMEYDEQGRLTREIRYQKEGDVVHDFIYNEAGLVEAHVYCRKIHRNTLQYDGASLNELGRTTLGYTKDGQLQRDGAYEWEYDNEGRLISKKTEGWECTFTYDGNTPVEASGKYIYDENGCLIQVGNVKYQYQAFTLSKEDADRCRRQQQMYLNSPADYDWTNYSIGAPYGYVVPSPLDPRLLVWPVTRYEK